MLNSAPEGKEKLSFCPERTLPPKNTLTQVAITVSWDSQFPLQCLSHGGDLLAFTAAGFVPYFRAGRWEMKSQRNLYHCNLMLVLVRVEGVYFLPLHPSHLEGSGSWREELSKKQRVNYWKQILKMHEETRMKGINKPLASCGAKEAGSVETSRFEWYQGLGLTWLCASWRSHWGQSKAWNLRPCSLLKLTSVIKIRVMSVSHEEVLERDHGCVSHKE